MATSIFSFITAWNELIFALTFVNDQHRYTLPVIVFFLLVQRRMVSGLVAGAVKG